MNPEGRHLGRQLEMEEAPLNSQKVAAVLETTLAFAFEPPAAWWYPISLRGSKGGRNCSGRLERHSIRPAVLTSVFVARVIWPHTYKSARNGIPGTSVHPFVTSWRNTACHARNTACSGQNTACHARNTACSAQNRACHARNTARSGRNTACHAENTACGSFLGAVDG